MAADASAATRRILTQLTPSIGRLKRLLAGPHGPGSPIFEQLVLRTTPDFDFKFSDFQSVVNSSTGDGVTISSDGNFWTYNESNAGATDIAKLTPTEAKSSCASMATTANAYNQGLRGPKAYCANQYAFIEARFMVSQVTDMQLTIGFADAVAATAGVIVSDIDTPAVATVADGAFYAIDISQTLKTAALVCVGTSTAVNKTLVAPTTAPYGVPTAATFLTVRVQLEGNGQTSGVSTVRLFINDALVATNTTGPDSEKLMQPIFFHGSPAATALTTDIDYIAVGAQKSGLPF